MNCANQLGFFETSAGEVAATRPSSPRPAQLLAPAVVPIACPCSFRPYPHILTDELAAQRHRRGEEH